MTRQFNQRSQNGLRSPSRNTSSGRYQEEQSSRPARPRLNRAMVDRGWENGTPRHHPDYHPQSSNGQAPRKNWSKNQERGYSSSHGPVGGRTNGNRQSDSNYQTQRSGSASQGYSTYRKQSLDSRGYRAENQQFDDRQGNEPYSYNNHRRQNNQRQSQEHGFNGRSNDYGSNHRPLHANSYGDDRPQRSPERNKGGGYMRFNERSAYSYQEQRGPYPRPQSQSGAFQRRQEGNRPQESQRYVPRREQFKGDYDHRSENLPQVFPDDGQPKASPAKKQAKPVVNGKSTKGTDAGLSPSNELRPFQRGYKWPTP